MKKMFRRSIAAVMFLAVGASLGSANTITYYVDVFGAGTATMVPIATETEVAPPASTSFDVPKLNIYDAPAGFYNRLNSVILSVNWSTTADLNVHNDDTVNPHSFTNGFTTVPETLTAGGTNVVANAITGPVSDTVAADTTNHYVGLTGNGTSSNPAAMLNNFERAGFGNITANFTMGSLAAGITDDGSGHLFANASNGTAGAVVTFQYNYDVLAIPEPMTMSLVGGALLGLGVLARKRSKKA